MRILVGFGPVLHPPRRPAAGGRDSKPSISFNERIPLNPPPHTRSEAAGYLPHTPPGPRAVFGPPNLCSHRSWVLPAGSSPALTPRRAEVTAVERWVEVTFPHRTVNCTSHPAPGARSAPVRRPFGARSAPVRRARGGRAGGILLILVVGTGSNQLFEPVRDCSNQFELVRTVSNWLEQLVRASSNH